MRVLVLGGDGYLGWPTAMYLARRGHHVGVVDNFSKRLAELEVGVEPLIPIQTLQERVRIFREVAGLEILLHVGDLRDYQMVERVVREFRPEVLVHYGEQPSAPYSMMDQARAVYTQANNVIGTLNVLWAMKHHAPDCHLVKLGCYDAETEVLTRRGWLSFEELEPEEEVCCLEPRTETIEYHRPSDIVRYPYTGKMCRIETRSIDCLVTPNHRVAFKRGLYRRTGPVEIERADALPDINLRIPRGGRWVAPDVATFELPSRTVRGPWGHPDRRAARQYPMDAWLAFFGLYLTEGCTRRREGRPTEVRLGAKKPSTVAAIRRALTGLELSWTEHEAEDGVRDFAVADTHLATYLAEFGLARDKHIPAELKQCSARQLSILYEALLEGDGHRTPAATDYFFSVSRKLLDDVQELALKIGKAATLCTWRGRGRTEHYLSIGRNVDAWVAPRRRRWEEYSGTVYCCTVPTGIIMTRRNGKLSWSGNTLGEYGTPNIDIEEGFIEIEHNGRRDLLPFPKQPGSFYHLSKVHDSHNIMFACRVWGLRSTDLNQGVVYGIETEETRPDERFATSFHYDQVFGTVLNRFCVQAVCGIPLTPYGTGNQKRGFLNINDTLQCVELALLNPPKAGEYRVFNQFTEIFSVLELAELVQKQGQKLGMDVRIARVANPRVESEDHYYNPKRTKLIELGLQPRYLSDELLESMLTTIARYRDRVRRNVILPRIHWRGER